MKGYSLFEILLKKRYHKIVLETMTGKRRHAVIMLIIITQQFYNDIYT